MDMMIVVQPETVRPKWIQYIITAKHGKSTSRNEAIVKAFHYMKIVEVWRTGIPRIISR